MATDTSAELLAEEPLPPGRPADRWLEAWPTIVSAGLALIVNVLVLAGLHLPFLGPALGFWFLIIQPAYLLYNTALWGNSSATERLAYSLAAVILVLMVAGLVADLVLPLVAINHPLDPVPVVLLADALTGLLYFLQRRYPRESRLPVDWAGLRAALSRQEIRVLTGSALSVVLAVLGANRLNNGAGDQVSLAALCVGVLTLICLLAWRYQLREMIIQVALYLLSLGLLLMTSLRGWYVTGHDIQNEFQVFQVTKAHGLWDTAFHNAYNACLSITILPTELADILRVDDPYIYKVFFQLIFAACPVMVYAISRRYWPVPVAILAAIYFISFPTFFTDMPFIDRQEIALVFVGVAALVITSRSWSLRRRQLFLLAACLGIEVSHYSSMYVFLGILVVAWVVLRAMHFAPWRPGGMHAHEPPWKTARSVVIAPVLGAAAVMTFTWGFLATQSPGAVISDAGASISGLFGHSASVRSDNVSYVPLFGNTPTAQQVLNAYSRSAARIRAGTPQTGYVHNLFSYNVTAIPQPLLPLTGVGRLLSDVGIPVTNVNSLMRAAAADSELVFFGLGLIAFLALRRHRRQVGWEFFCLACGGLIMLATVTVLPGLSVDYSVLRVFQEALILIAPVIVAGSLALFRPLGDTWTPRVAAGVCIGIFASTTGLLPQLLGAAPAQLNLNNSGIYYDSYYVHPTDIAGSQWLSGQLGVLPGNIQATHYSDRYLFTAPRAVNDSQFIEEGYPALVRNYAWVVLDYSIVHTGLATASYDGDIIPYRYPIGILGQNKNLVYSNGGMQIYKASQPPLKKHKQ
jgi:uncharacterized membrane protein